MRAHKTTMVNNTFFIIITGNIGNIADWKINGVLEYFRYMAILQKKRA